MKLSEFKPAKSAAPVSPRAANSEPDAVASAPQEPQGTTTVTPSGIEIAYEWAPRRLYKLRPVEPSDDAEWREVPSVTTVLGVLDKSGPLTWWGMKVGVEGVLSLVKDEHLYYRERSTSYSDPPYLITPEPAEATVADVVELLTEHKLTVNHVKDKAADRGVNVHSVLEEWTPGKTIAWDHRPENEQGYVRGLAGFLTQIEEAVEFGSLDMELMVGSLEHQYAGRFDLVLTLSKPVEVVTRCYPKKPPKVEEIPVGRVLIDMKTSKRVYPATHFMQLEAYEAAAVECGYEPTDYRAILHVTEDGKYELAINRDWTIDDFLTVRACYQTINERQVIQSLRDELGAKEVSE